jgi:rod shape-determining protein MreD
LRWFLLAILAYAFLLIQTTLFRPGLLAIEVSEHYVAPDLLLVVGLFLVLYFEPREVFVVGWCLGMASDLVNVVGRLGVCAILFSVSLVLATYLRQMLGRPRALAQFFLCLGLVLVVHAVWYAVAGWFEERPVAVGRVMVAAGLDALYSAILAPYAIWLLSKFHGPLRLAVE